MNKPHAAAYRKPASASAILAAIDRPTTWMWIAGIAQTLRVPRGALKRSSSLT